MKPAVASAVLAVLAVVVVAAPVTKPKVEPLGPPTPDQFEAAEKNLKQIALAWHNYADTNNHFPGYECDKDGKALLSWRVQILPFIEQEELFKQFKLDQPWDSDHNKKLIDKMPKLYAPVRGKLDDGLTYYQAFTGSHGLISPGKQVTFVNITDGTSNTLMCVEAAKPVIWTKPDDLEFNGKNLPALGGLFDGKFHAAFCDGSVRRFRKEIKAETLIGLITPNGGEVFSLEGALDEDEKK
jgi:prepilin-type processing-associated H-X9-DG protein